MPENASAGWCLPANLGPVYLRGYNTYKSRPYDLLDERGNPLANWGLDRSLVPTWPSTAKECHGPHGPLSEGDCVIYVGLVRGEGPDPLVWFPQRVISVEEPRNGWQHVESALLWTDEDFIDASALGEERLEPGPLRGRARRRVLELFNMNLDCEYCGGQGGHVVYGPPRDPAGPFDSDKILRQPGDPTYMCHCGAQWYVLPDGTLKLDQPMPII